MVYDDNLSAPMKISCPASNRSSMDSSSSITLRCSWAEEMERSEFQQGDNSSELQNKCNTSADGNKKRFHEFEFVDGVNEEKYERLVQQGRLRTPVKRRHDGSNPESPNSINNSGAGSSSNNSSIMASEELTVDCGTAVVDNMMTIKVLPTVKVTNAVNSGRNNTKNIDEYPDGKRLRHNSYNSSTSSGSFTESDPAVLERRQKQIDYGKNTTAYERYVEQVPRRNRTREQPSTPNKYGKYSRRAFDGLIRLWRKQLHSYDIPDSKSGIRKFEDSSSDSDD